MEDKGDILEEIVMPGEVPMWIYKHCIVLGGQITIPFPNGVTDQDIINIQAVFAVGMSARARQLHLLLENFSELTTPVIVQKAKEVYRGNR